MSDDRVPTSSEPTDLLMRETVQRAVLGRINSSASKSFIVRGGILMRAFVGRAARPTVDLDFLSTIPFEPVDIVTRLKQALVKPGDDDKLTINASSIDYEIKWAETASPGLRTMISVEHNGNPLEQSIDIGFDDPMIRPPIWRELELGSGPAIGVWAVDEEQSFAWKLHEVFEGHTWHNKHLYDLHVLLACCQFDEMHLIESIRLAFDSRGTPIQLIARLLEGDFGQSKRRQQSWRALRRKYANLNIPEDHMVLVRQLADFIRPLRARIEGS